MIVGTRKFSQIISIFALSTFFLGGCSSLPHKLLPKEAAKIAKDRDKYVMESIPDWWLTINNEDKKGMLIVLSHSGDSFIPIVSIPEETKLKATEKYISASEIDKDSKNNSNLICYWIWREELAMPPDEIPCSELVDEVNRIEKIKNEFAYIQDKLNNIDKDIEKNLQEISKLYRNQLETEDILSLTQEAQKITDRVHGIVSDQIQANSAQIRSDNSAIKIKLEKLANTITQALECSN